MNTRPSPAELLARDLAVILAGEPYGLSCDAIAKRLHRRRPDVLAALRADGRFLHEGRTHGSRWRLDASGRDGSGWVGMNADAPGASTGSTSPPLSEAAAGRNRDAA